MKVVIANDHHGVKQKYKIIEYLESKGIEVNNIGSDSEDITDYVDYAINLCALVNTKEYDFGILICGTGIGMSIVANKVKGIMCGLISSVEDARLAKAHNRINVIAFSENTNDLEEILNMFINTEYLNDERYLRRIKKIEELDERR